MQGMAGAHDPARLPPPLQHHRLRPGAVAPLRRPQVPPHPRRPRRPWPAAPEGLRASPPCVPERVAAGPHAEEYLRSLRRPDVLAGILEVPVVRRLPAWAIDWRILRSMRYATGGTFLACRLALEHGIADQPRRRLPPCGIGLGRRLLRVRRRAAGGEASSTTRARSGGCWSWTSTPTRATARPPSSRAGIGPPSTTSTRRNSSRSRKEPEDFPLPVGPGLTGSEYLDHRPGLAPRSPRCRPARSGRLQRRVGPVRGRPAGPLSALGGRPGRA